MSAISSHATRQTLALNATMLVDTTLSRTPSKDAEITALDDGYTFHRASYKFRALRMDQSLPFLLSIQLAIQASCTRLSKALPTEMPHDYLVGGKASKEMGGWVRKSSSKRSDSRQKDGRDYQVADVEDPRAHTREPNSGDKKAKVMPFDYLAGGRPSKEAGGWVRKVPRSSNMGEKDTKEHPAADSKKGKERMQASPYHPESKSTNRLAEAVFGGRPSKEAGGWVRKSTRPSSGRHKEVRVHPQDNFEDPSADFPEPEFADHPRAAMPSQYAASAPYLAPVDLGVAQTRDFAPRVAARERRYEQAQFAMPNVIQQNTGYGLAAPYAGSVRPESSISNAGRNSRRAYQLNGEQMTGPYMASYEDDVGVQRAGPIPGSRVGTGQMPPLRARTASEARNSVHMASPPAAAYGVHGAVPPTVGMSNAMANLSMGPHRRGRANMDDKHTMESVGDYEHYY